MWLRNCSEWAILPHCTHIVFIYHVLIINIVPVMCLWCLSCQLILSHVVEPYPQLGVADLPKRYSALITNSPCPFIWPSSVPALPVDGAIKINAPFRPFSLLPNMKSLVRYFRPYYGRFYGELICQLALCFCPALFALDGEYCTVKSNYRNQ